MRKVLYFDTETTGTNPVKNGIIQFAAIVEIDGEEKERVNFKIRPHESDEIDEKALMVNGITKEMLEFEEDRLSSQEGYWKVKEFFCRWVDQYDPKDKFYPAGYNVRFDLEFLHNFFKKHGDSYFGSFVNWRCVDPLGILFAWDYLGMMSLENYKLGTVCKEFGIAINAHDAMSDIEATRELTKRILETVKQLKS